MSQEIVLAALNSDPITAYVDAVIVPSNPDRNTLENMAKKGRQDTAIPNLCTDSSYQSQSKGTQAEVSNPSLLFSQHLHQSLKGVAFSHQVGFQLCRLMAFVAHCSRQLVGKSSSWRLCLEYLE